MDFSVMNYIEFSMLTTRRLLTGRLLPGQEGLETEAELETKRVTPKGESLICASWLG